MSKYTVSGSVELDNRIDADMARISEACAPHCMAGILIGGYGRGEGTPFIHPDGSQSPFNDYDLVVVVEMLDTAVRERLKALEKSLTSELGLPVDLYPCRRDSLAGSEYSLLNYEMKYGLRVIWGDEHVLDAMPDYPADAIPLSEGSRLLLNRGKLLLDIKLRLAKPEPLREEERIRFIKFISKVWLAMGDCALLAARKYDISYSVKRERIASVENIPHNTAVIDEYLAAVDLKNRGDYHARLVETDIEEAFRRVRAVFLEFFEWYRKHHAVRECAVIKAMLLNLKWNRWPYLCHPRRRLYEALPELLSENPDKIVLGQILCCSRNVESRFYQLQARFS
jgi:predicted nucleotidyltransferase